MSSVLFFSKVQKGPSLLDLMSLQYVGNWSTGRKPAVFGRAHTYKSVHFSFDRTLSWSQSGKARTLNHCSRTAHMSKPLANST